MREDFRPDRNVLNRNLAVFRSDKRVPRKARASPRHNIDERNVFAFQFGNVS